MARRISFIKAPAKYTYARKTITLNDKGILYEKEIAGAKMSLYRKDYQAIHFNSDNFIYSFCLQR